MKDVVFLKFTDVKSFLVVKEYIYIYIYNRKKGRKDGEVKKPFASKRYNL